MFTFLLTILGWLLARAPEPLVRAIAALMGTAMPWLLPRRRRLVLSNLAHAFPARGPIWRRRVARRSWRRLAETSMLALATPFLSERRIRRIARLGPSAEAWARDRAARPRPVVFGTVHLALWESQTWFRRLSPVPLPEFGIIYRPLDDPALDRFVKRSRERFGMRLLSRREGFAQALAILRGNGCVGLLFDQNAGMQGALTTLFGRVCSTTELPGLLAVKCGAELRSFYPRRTGFWRATFETDPIAHDGTAEGATLALNRWLEDRLERDDELCASWLWSHDRWRHQDRPARRFRLESKRNLLAADFTARGWSGPPQGLRLWVRMPNWLGDVVLAMPFIRALRAGRPDAEITLLAHARFLPLLAGCGAHRLEPLPARGAGYFGRFLRLRGSYPDVWLLFTQSLRGDLEARLAGCPQRFGLVRPGKQRPLLSDAFTVPADFDESRRHQRELWEAFLRHFGLEGSPDYSPPLASAPAPADAPIGLIPGSENAPEKRWPVGHWRRLIVSLPKRRFVVFGTAGDRPLAEAVAAGFDPGRVQNLAGRTDLLEFGRGLRRCRLLVTNDTGGMHLANALGVPLAALFGPTNPIRTGPVFEAPRLILQPPGCPPTGGAPLEALDPAAVAAAVADLEVSIEPCRS